MGLISFTVLSLNAPAREKAVIKMAIGLILVWIAGGGSLMYSLRERVKSFFRTFPGPWQIKFFHLLWASRASGRSRDSVHDQPLAPFFSADMMEAFITASANYLPTVLFHSVIVFLPMFLTWSILLSVWNFPPDHVFLLFGLTSSMAEMSMNPPTVLAGFWFFVYSLILYLPAYSLPERRSTRKPSWFSYPAAAAAPLVSSILLLPLS